MVELLESQKTEFSPIYSDQLSRVVVVGLEKIAPTTTST
jgi:hypothetical protein